MKIKGVSLLAAAVAALDPMVLAQALVAATVVASVLPEPKRISKPIPANRCANGLTGCGMEDGQLYNPRNPCSNPREIGHIFCDQCREGSGGYPKRKAIIAAAGNTRISSNQ